MLVGTYSAASLSVLLLGLRMPGTVALIYSQLQLAVVPLNYLIRLTICGLPWTWCCWQCMGHLHCLGCGTKKFDAPEIPVITVSENSADVSSSAGFPSHAPDMTFYTLQYHENTHQIHCNRTPHYCLLPTLDTQWPTSFPWCTVS